MALDPLDLAGRNAAYAADFDDGGLSAPARLGLAVLTCIDSRVDPHAILDLGPGDAKVVRNAGGRATPDAVRSLMVATHLLGVTRVAVVHHTDCGNAGTDDELAGKLRDAGLDDPPRPLHANGPDALEVDVAGLRGSGQLALETTVEGYVYDVRTGRIRHVEVSQHDR